MFSHRRLVFHDAGTQNAPSTAMARESDDHPSADGCGAPDAGPGRHLHCVLDIEASGFGSRSYPIEVGWVQTDGRTGCMLIRPAPGWDHWDRSAESVHGITRETLLRHGREPVEVALRLNADLAGQTVYSDAWGHDYAWLARLYDAADLVPTFRLEPAARLFGDTALAQLDAAHREAFAELAVQRHRASNDARALQRALQAVSERRG
jgi:hypothetical protein